MDAEIGHACRLLLDLPVDLDVGNDAGLPPSALTNRALIGMTSSGTPSFSATAYLTRSPQPRRAAVTKQTV